MNPITIVIPIFPDVEILDFCGPYEVFSSVRLDESRRREDPSPFRVLLAAETLEPVVCKGGLRVLPDTSLEACPALDWLIVPGGWGVRQQIDNPRLTAWIASRAASASLVGAVCTGAMLLGRAALLSGRRATTHITTLDWMRSEFPDVQVQDDLRFVEDGTLITSAGVSAGIDMALYLVERTVGAEIARATAAHMEYHRIPGSRRV